MAKIEVDSDGNVKGNFQIKNGDTVQFQAVLPSNKLCVLKVKFKEFVDKNNPGTQDAASAGTIKIGS
jgi:hypothetical protein